MTDWKIPFSGRQHEYTLDEMTVVLKAMMGANPLTQGSYRDEFEAAFAKYLDVPDGCFAVSNATCGLELAAQLCQFEPGDEVIIPAHTFTSTAYPFIKHGAKVVWADIDPETHVVTADTLEPHITPSGVLRSSPCSKPGGRRVAGREPGQAGHNRRR